MFCTYCSKGLCLGSLYRKTQGRRHFLTNCTPRPCLAAWFSRCFHAFQLSSVQKVAVDLIVIPNNGLLNSCYNGTQYDACIYRLWICIYIYTYIYTISGLFFGSTVVALGVRMYWKSELKILICLGAVNPQRWRWNHIPEFNGPYDAGWDIQHPNIALYIARVLYPWAYQPIPNLNQTLHKKNTSFNFYINFFFSFASGAIFPGVWN